MARASRFGIVGTGWRSRFYLKLANLLPAQLEVVGIVGRNAQRAELPARQWGTQAHASLAELVAAEHPDFVVSAVPWAVTPDVTRAAVELGVPILCETPPAPDVDGLRSLWATVGASGLAA